MKIAIFASGRGSNFAAIARAVQRKIIKNTKIALLITDVKDAPVRKLAKKYKVPDIFISPEDFSDKKSYEEAIIKILKKEKVSLVVLAGFMKILSPYFLKYFPQKIINIHPSLLPAFKGKDAIKRAYNYGCKVTGVTVHFVTEEVDAGPIILQEGIPITARDSLKTLEEKIHKTEHKLYPKAIALIAKEKVLIRGRKTFFKK